jgi:hypothetical protein
MITLRCLLFGALVLVTGAGSAAARGLACAQDCSSGTCAQADCASPVAGNDFCQCSSGAVPLGGDVYAAYCRSWGSPQPGCGEAAPAVDRFGNAVTPPTPQLPNATAMATALSSQNPYVAALVVAMQDGGSWANAPVKGLLHDSHYDSASGDVSHTAAVQFAGNAVTTGLGNAQVDIAVQGDVGQLAWLKQYCSSAAPAAIPPMSIHGTVTGGGLHGALVVLSAGGQSQTIQW